MATRQEAEFENRTYYFTLQSKTDNEIRIEMYNTLYVLVRSGEKWENHNSNRFNLNPQLVNVVVGVVLKRPVSQ